MEAFKTATKVEKDGTVTLHGVPFAEGAEVEVVVRQISSDAEPTPAPPHPHRGSVLKYDDPFAPAAPEEDWEALR